MNSDITDHAIADHDRAADCEVDEIRVLSTDRRGTTIEGHDRAADLSVSGTCTWGDLRVAACQDDLGARRFYARAWARALTRWAQDAAKWALQAREMRGSLIREALQIAREAQEELEAWCVRERGRVEARYAIADRMALGAFGAIRPEFEGQIVANSGANLREDSALRGILQAQARSMASATAPVQESLVALDKMRSELTAALHVEEP